jgi:acyl carrier protein
MDNQQIFEKLNSIVKIINSNAQIKKNTTLTGESVLDSLEFMNYITKIEEEFSINISDSEITNQRLGIVKNMINYISSKIQ